MKIVYFNYLYDLYGTSIGSTRKAECLMSDLAEVGNEVKIYWLKRQAPNDQSLKMQVKNVFKKRLSKYLHDPKQLLSNIKYIFEEYRIIKNEAPDLIISRLDLYLFSSLLLSKLMKIPIIIEADGPVVYEAREFQKKNWKMGHLDEFIEKINLKKSDMSVCVSNAAREHFINKGVPDHKILTITNGAYTERFHPSIDTTRIVSKYNLDGKVVIGFVGSFNTWHGVENLIKIISKAILEYDNTIFLMVGDGGGNKSALDNFVKNEKLENRVIQTGYVQFEEMPEYISAMDIVLAPYPNLKFFYYSPVKIFEYMACGKSVIATGIGQIAEIINDGYNGILCEPDNIEQIITKLSELIKNSGLRESIGRNARKTIVSDHTWRRKAEQFSEVCHNVLKNYNSTD